MPIRKLCSPLERALALPEVREKLEISGYHGVTDPTRTCSKAAHLYPYSRYIHGELGHSLLSKARSEAAVFPSR